jgi:DNA-binding NtrC family response regulator
MAKILVLDDVSDAVNLIRRILEETGHTVYPFTEEDEALSFAAENAVDLAILDIKLKKMSGVEVLAELKRLAPAVRTIILTGYPTVETAQASFQLGAADYCVKPIDNEDLASKVNTLLASKP